VRLYSYVVARDFGFAPNPFYGFCTLCTCKPVIRRTAAIGDWILGTGSKAAGRENRVVFAMCVKEALTLEEYWGDPRFLRKRPNLQASKMSAFGDNIYWRDGMTGRWRQEDSHHSHPDGTENQANVLNDTRTNRMLVASEFIYWGGAGPDLPPRLRQATLDVRAKRGHRSNFPSSAVEEVVEWLSSFAERGCVGEPLDWRRSP
jgi:hypothetical protein